MNLIKLLVATLVFAFGVPSLTLASDIAVLFDRSGNAGRINLTDATVKLATVKTDNEPFQIYDERDSSVKLLAVDGINRNLFLLDCDNGCRVHVISLLDFEQKATLAVEPETDEVKISVLPDGSKLLVQYVLPDDGDDPGGFTTDIYDAKTLIEIGNCEDFFNLDKIIYSKDRSKIYSVVRGTEAHASVITTGNCSITNVIDLRAIERKDIKFVDLDDAKSGLVLFVESVKQNREDPDNLDFSVFDLDTLSYVKRVQTGLQGNLILSPDGKTVLLDEYNVIRKKLGSGSETYVFGFQSLGKMTGYDSNTGAKKGTVTFSVVGEGKILGFDPSGKKAIYGYNVGDGTSTVLVIDTATMSIAKTYSLPFEAEYFGNYQEPDAPSSLKVTPTAAGLELTWVASPQDPGCVTGYEISRSDTSGGSFTLLTKVDKGILKYTDITAENGKKYYYKIRAVSDGLLSPYTDEVSDVSQKVSKINSNIKLVTPVGIASTALNCNGILV